jgi:vacuolar-type H+-ATPase subunit I/STV1
MYSSIIPILVWLIILAVVAFAWIKGDRPERLGGLSVLAAGVVAIAIHGLAQAEWQPMLLLADEALLAVAFLLLALRYTSAWLGASP